MSGYRIDRNDHLRVDSISNGLPSSIPTVTVQDADYKQTVTEPGIWAGQYRYHALPEVRPGSYTVSISAPGYKPSSRSGVVVDGYRGCDHTPTVVRFRLQPE